MVIASEHDDSPVQGGGLLYPPPHLECRKQPPPPAAFPLTSRTQAKASGHGDLVSVLTALPQAVCVHSERKPVHLATVVLRIMAESGMLVPGKAPTKEVSSMAPGAAAAAGSPLQLPSAQQLPRDAVVENASQSLQAFAGSQQQAKRDHGATTVSSWVGVASSAAGIGKEGHHHGLAVRLSLESDGRGGDVNVVFAKVCKRRERVLRLAPY